MKTKEDLLDKHGVRIFGAQQKRILEAMEEYASQFKAKEVNMCTGKIDQHGFCERCYQPASTTSNQCNRIT